MPCTSAIVEDVLLGVSDDRNLQGNRSGKRVIDNRVEGNAEDQNAVHQRGQEQHWRKPVRMWAGLEDERINGSFRIDLIGV